MNRILKYLLSLSITIFITAVSTAQQHTIRLQLQPGKTVQTIENFGASGCWFSEGIGKYWRKEQKDSIARFLFSRNFDANGNPSGIGLSAWRFNIGGGTAEQGTNSGIKTFVKRIECFLDSAGNYDWTKQSGYQWFVQQAKNYGVENLIAFSNTPPVFFTKNHLGFKTEKDYTCNLAEDKYDDYAVFLAKVLKHFDSAGLHFKYISPVNEPQWDWSNKFGEMNQEGSPWHNDNIAKIVSALDSVILSDKIRTGILLPEAATLKHLYGESERAGKQIQYFFGNTGANTAHLKSVHPVVAGHSYFTDAGDSMRVTIRENVRDTAKAYKTAFWQSEYSMLGDGYREGKKGRITAIDCALFLAKMIHTDLTSANAAAWQLWNVYEPGSADFDTRYYLIALNSNDSNTAGSFSITKNLWAMGHFSRFIRPGMKRILIKRSDSLNEIRASRDLMSSAYIDDSGNTVVVIINYSTEAKQVDCRNVKNGKQGTIYSTTAEPGVNMQRRGIKNLSDIKIPPRSIHTLVISTM